MKLTSICLIGDNPELISGYVQNVSFTDTNETYYNFPCYIALNCNPYCIDENHNKFFGSMDNRLCEFAERCQIQGILVDLYLKNETETSKKVIRIEFGEKKSKADF